MPKQMDPERKQHHGLTGICVRALDEAGKMQNADIAELTPEALLEWLRSDGEKNRLAENVVGILLGYGHIATGGGGEDDGA